MVQHAGRPECNNRSTIALALLPWIAQNRADTRVLPDFATKFGCRSTEVSPREDFDGVA